jgi:DtxR family Mn-dependent transcriptional regulator
MNQALTEAMEDYLKTIYHLREESVVYGDATRATTTQAVAESLKVAPPSATAMIKKLAALDLVTHTPYRGVELTPNGQKAALEIVRHHRLSETFLAQIMGIGWDKAHQEADKWEHVLSEEVEERMAALLGHPTHDPHGAPIPLVDGQMPSESLHQLSRIEAGQNAVVRRVHDEDAALLRYLKEVGVVPGTAIEVVRANPSEGVLELHIEGRTLILGLIPAAAILVEAQEKETA